MNGGNWLELNPCRYFRANPVPQWPLSGPVQNNTTTSLAYSTQVPVQLTGYTSYITQHTVTGLELTLTPLKQLSCLSLAHQIPLNH